MGSSPRTLAQPSLDVLQMVRRYFGTLLPDVAEQVIEVPEISPQDGNLQRASLRAPQLVEQLEVPTVPFSFEQIIDNPVPGRGVSGHGGLQGFLPEQSSTAFGGADHRVHYPVRGLSVWLWRSSRFRSSVLWSRTRISSRLSPTTRFNSVLQSTTRISSRFTPKTEFVHVLWSRTWNSSRFTPRGGFNGVFRRCKAWWWCSRLCPRTEFLVVFSEVQVLVEGLKTFVMMLGSWSRRRSSARTTGTGGTARIAGDCQLACVMVGTCVHKVLRPRRVPSRDVDAAEVTWGHCGGQCRQGSGSVWLMPGVRCFPDGLLGWC